MNIRPSTQPSPRARQPAAGHRGLNGARPAGSAASRGSVEREALLLVAAAVAGANDLDGVLELAAEEALRAIGGASLSISRFERGGKCCKTLINVGQLGPGEQRYPADEVYETKRFPLLERMLETGRPYFNALDDPDCDAASAEVLTQFNKSSDLGVPIQVEGETWGEVWATTIASSPPFRSEDVQFLEAIAGQLASAITRAVLFSEVSRLAYEDPLTSLANRRAFDERLERAMTRFNADGASVGLLLCDLDCLKVINDTHGHIVGDRALRAVAKTLVAAAAEFPGAFVARLGGDEFCVLVENTALPAARELAGIVEVGTNAQKLLGDVQLDVSLSMGAAIAGRGTGDPALLLKAADTAQYVAKRRGGNRVCTAAQVAEERKTTPAFEEARGTATERILAATDRVVERLDGEMLRSPVLDRLEVVAAAYAEAANFARWAISFAGAGRSYLRDLSFGENRNRISAGIRVVPGFEEYETYELDEFPATAKIVAAGSGSFNALINDESSDLSERGFLEEHGFTAVVGAAAGDEDGVYLVELVADEESPPSILELEAALRVAVRAAMPPKPHRRTSSKLTSGHSRALELSLGLAHRLSGATAETDICEAAVEELYRAFSCSVVHIVAVVGNYFELRAENSGIRTSPNWTQHTDAGILGRCIREGGPVLVAEVSREPQYRATDATRDVRSELAVPIMVGGEPWGVINLEDVSVEAFNTDDARLIESVAAQLGGALNAIALYESLDRAYMQTAEALSAALEAKDSYTAEHSRSIADNATAVGEVLGMEPEELRMLRYAAAFHDIGKLAISQEILNKPAALNEQERKEIEQHTVIGERILAPVEFLAPVRPFVRSAHERWDGAGYPDGLVGEEIPLGARILFTCDAYDAMTTDRSYRKRLPESEARNELLHNSGSQFDPRIVDILLSLLNSHDEERKAETSTLEAPTSWLSGI